MKSGYKCVAAVVLCAAVLFSAYDMRGIEGTYQVQAAKKDDLQKRLNSKGNDKIEQRGLEYLLSLQERIKSITQKLSLEHHIIDANLPKDSITTKIIDFIGKENCVV